MAKNDKKSGDEQDYKAKPFTGDEDMAPGTSTPKSEAEKSFDQFFAADVPEGWVDEQVGFPPYWSPEMGSAFRGMIMYRDERQPEFIRYVVQASAPIRCHRGPSDDEQEEVIVQPGELFTTTAYAALPLERYFGFEVWVLAEKKRTLAASTNPNAKEGQKRKREQWDFRIRVSPETKKLLDDQRSETAKLLQTKREEARRNAMAMQIASMA